MGNLPPFPTLSPEAIETMVMTEAGISIIGLSVSLLALGYDHVMCVQPRGVDSLPWMMYVQTYCMYGFVPTNDTAPRSPSASTRT